MHMPLSVTSGPQSVNDLVTVVACVKGTCALLKCEFVASCIPLCFFRVPVVKPECGSVC